MSSISPIATKAASLAIMGGGPARAFAAVRPLSGLMGRNVAVVGGNGNGQTTRVANQIVVALTMEAGADPAHAW